MTNSAYKGTENGLTRKRRYTPRARACKVCGTVFKPPMKGGHARFCSHACRQAAYYKRAKRAGKIAPKPPAPLVQVVCVHCGASVLAVNRPQQLYCSKRCRKGAAKAKARATVAALATVMGGSRETAALALDGVGMARAAAVLAARGLTYNAAARAWRGADEGER